MANITTLKSGGSTTHTGGVLHHEIDVADFVAAGGVTTDTCEVVTIPADSLFKLWQVEVIDAVVLGGSARIDIGDTADDDEFVTNATTYTAGTNLTLLKNEGTPGAVYTAANALRVKFTGDGIATGKLRFVYELKSTKRNAPAETITP
jgi:hypothetical protein